ncbi:MAG TPA: type II/IV secretion system protein, partial [Desulfobacterales bacterium]|nr:type II/IV secretion system protein [Desulfobacterales bacterium]
DLDILQKMSEERKGDQHAVVKLADAMILLALKERASDIHLEPKEKCLRVRYRVDGVLRHKTDLPISLAASLMSRIKVLSALDIAERRRHQDGRIQARVMDTEVDLRVSVYASAYGENIVIRILHRVSELIELDALGMSPGNRAIFQRMLDQPSGIILVTGPTGSGKTTALYAALNYLNDGQRAIITVEDPIEYTMDGVVQGQLDSKLGLTYVDFLKSMMRQDPDVIMVGEIRDSTAAEAVIQAALTGHKVLSTFHTDDTTGALLRLMDMGIDTFLISSTVVSIVSQRLVRKLCPQCRKPSVPDQNLFASFGVAPTGAGKLTFYQPVGCSRCGDTGFTGRTAVHEVLIVTDAIRDAILARKTSSQIRLIARDEARLISMREDGFYKATQGITSLEEVLRVVFQNEGDEVPDRSPEEIVALCEKLPSLIPKQPDSVLIGGKTSVQKGEDSVSIIDSNLSVLEGEVYRIRFDVTTIESETDQISDFFKAYQGIMEELGNSLESDSLGDFADFIIYTVKRLEVSLKSEFVEFYLRVKEGKARIYVESLIPQKPSSSTLHTTRETGLRLIHYLMPSSGMEKALKTESILEKRRGRYRRTASLIGFLEQEKSRQHKGGGAESKEGSSSRPQSAEGPQIHDALYAKSSVLYKKHVEELELSAYLKK